MRKASCVVLSCCSVLNENEKKYLILFTVGAALGPLLTSFISSSVSIS